jgi:hypothetical protein
VAQHHDGHACCRHEVVVALDDLPVEAVISLEFAEPVVEVLEHPEATGAHALDHLDDAGLDQVAALRVRGVRGQHVEAFVLVEAHQLTP